MFTSYFVSNVLRLGLRAPLQRLVASSPTAALFAQHPEQIPPHILVRHMAEHVHRIRMFRALDVEATSEIDVVCSTECATLWGRYARSEATHDRYFLRDLRAVGFERQDVERWEPFPATRQLGAFVSEAMAAYGPLPVVLYSFWAEQNSDVGSNAVIARTMEALGSAATRGAVAHRALDLAQSHTELVDAVLAELIRDEVDLSNAIVLLDLIGSIVGRYFAELGAWSRRVEALAIAREAQHPRTL